MTYKTRHITLLWRFAAIIALLFQALPARSASPVTFEDRPVSAELFDINYYNSSTKNNYTLQNAQVQSDSYSFTFPVQGEFSDTNGNIVPISYNFSTTQSFTKAIYLSQGNIDNCISGSGSCIKFNSIWSNAKLFVFARATKSDSSWDPLTLYNANTSTSSSRYISSVNSDVMIYDISGGSMGSPIQYYLYPSGESDMKIYFIGVSINAELGDEAIASFSPNPLNIAVGQTGIVTLDPGNANYNLAYTWYPSSGSDDTATIDWGYNGTNECHVTGNAVGTREITGTFISSDYTVKRPTFTVNVSEPVVYSTALSAVTVGGNTIVPVDGVYTTTAGGTLAITSTSATAVVKVAKVRSQACDDPSVLTTYATAPSSVAVPSQAGTSNYYYISVSDTDCTTAYYLLKVSNPTDYGANDQRVIDGHLIIGPSGSIPFTTSETTFNTDGSTGFFPGNNNYIYAYGGPTENSTNHYVKAINDYIELGKAVITDNQPVSGIISLKVAGKGLLKLTATNNNGGGSNRTINVYDGGLSNSNLLSSFYPTTKGVYETFNIEYNANSPTTIWICPTSHATRVNQIEWIPATDESLSAVLTWDPEEGYETLEIDQWTHFKAIPKCDDIDVSDEFDFRYFYKGENGILAKYVDAYTTSPLSYGDEMWPYESYIGYKANALGSAPIDVTLTPKDGSSFTEALNGTFTVNVTGDFEIKVNDSAIPVITDPYVTGVASVYSTHTAGTLSTTITFGSVTYAPVTNVIKDPTTLSYSDVTPTVVIPAAGSGLINYYYIKVVTGGASPKPGYMAAVGETYYYVVEASSETGTDNGIRVIDKAVHFGNGSSTKFTAAEEKITSHALVSDNPYIYAYASDTRDIIVRPNEIIFSRSGQFSGATPQNGVIEIRVSGPGMLKLGAYTTSDRTYDQLIVATPNIENTDLDQLGVFTLPYDGFYPVKITEAKTIYIYPNSTGIRLTDIVWEPESSKTIPTITWYGSHEKYIHDDCTEYAEITDGLTLSYKIIKDGANYTTSSTIGNPPNLSYLSEGTFVISASFAGNEDYEAVSMPFTITVSKRTPQILLIDLGNLYTVVGGNSRISQSELVALTASNMQAHGQNGNIAYFDKEATDAGVPDGTSKGVFTISADGKFIDASDDNYLIGKAIGTGTFTVTWTPTDAGAANKYTAVSQEFTIPVRPGTLALSFAKESANVAMERSVIPSVIATNELGETVPELTFTYQLPTTTLATLNSEKNIITAANTPGTVSNITAQYSGAIAIDNNPAHANYITTTTTANTQPAAIKTFTLNIERIATKGRLTLIPDQPPFYGDNLASMAWSNETNTSGADASIFAPRLVMDCKYISADNRFRIEVMGTEKLVNDDHAAGIQLTDPNTTLCFYAQGSARLQLSGFASVKRTIEIYAVNRQDYTGWESHDPSFATDVSKLIGRLSIPAGAFSAAETFIDLAEAGNNYYFLKTTTGGLILSTIDWVQAKMRPYIIAPESITIEESEKAVSVMDYDVQAYTYATNSETHADSERKYWIFDNTTANQASSNTYPVEFSYYTYDTGIVEIDAVSGVITPKRAGTATVYIELKAGTVSYTPAVGSPSIIEYGTQRQAITVIVPDGIEIISAKFTPDEIVYSSKTSGSGIWLTPTVKDSAGKDIVASNYNLEYHLQYPDGTNITDASIASIASDGTVTIVNPTALDGQSIQVVADVTKTGAAGVQTYYTVYVTTGLTIPTVSYDASIGMKEMVTPGFTDKLPSGDEPNKRREYYMRANYQENTNSNTGKKEADVVLTFTIPTTTPGISMKYSTDFGTTPTTAVTITDGNATITVANPNTAADRQIWVQLSADGSTEIWNGFYLIHFVAIPSATMSGNKNDDSRTATFTSNNAGYNGTLYYSFDSSTPTADSHQYKDPIHRTSNAVYNVVEVFTPNANGFTDGSFSYTTNVLYNMELEITDSNVIEVLGENSNTNAGTIEPNWSNQLRVPLEGPIEARMMMGGNDVEVFDGSSFKTNGVVWDTGHDFDSGIPSYIDIYKYYISASNNGTKDSNPYTEYNRDLGGEGSGLGTFEAAPYVTPVSGAFFRFEAEYNGVVTVWIRQNGASASSAWTNTHKSDGSLKEVGITNNSTTVKQEKLYESFRITRRPVFIMDETGTLMQRNTAAYNAEWDFDGTANDDGSIDKKKAYKNINGSVADVSQQSILDKDFMWGWNHLCGSDDKNCIEAGRWEASWLSMDFYNRKYQFHMSMPDKKDKDNRTTTAVINKLDQFDYSSKIPIVDIIYSENSASDLQDYFGFMLYGYELPMPNYVRYRIPVKAGKTYYMGGRQTKNSFCAVKFDNDHTTDNLASYTLDEDGANNWTHDGSVKDGQQINVTIKRSFSKGKWSPIVLPFSVSESRLRDMFGDDVIVLTLDQYYKYSSGFEMPAAVYVNAHGVTADLMFTRHHYQMLYANTPAYICPSFEWNQTAGRTKEEVDKLEANLAKDANGFDCKTSVTFPRVTFVAGGVNETNIGSGYVVTGNYGATENTENGEMYYLTNTIVDGNYMAKMFHSAEGIAMKGTRCWISKRGGMNAPALTNLGMTRHDGTILITDDMSAVIDTAVDNIASEAWSLDPCVYNLQGMAVARVGEGADLDSVLSRLSAGIYIYKGQKYAVKIDN